METLDLKNIDRISHNIRSLSQDMYIIKKAVLDKEKEINTSKKQNKKRLNSLKKAQMKFKNISTNLKIDEYKEFEKRLEKLKMNKSAYLKKLILDDLKKNT